MSRDVSTRLGAWVQSGKDADKHIRDHGALSQAGNSQETGVEEGKLPSALGIFRDPYVESLLAFIHHLPGAVLGPEESHTMRSWNCSSAQPNTV